MIKYRYALNQINELVDVTKLERVHLKDEDKFYSVDYHQELIPRLGKIKVKHFAHKPQNDVLGSSETYLHALGKRFFSELYEKCLAEGTPFYIKYEEQKICTRLEKEFNCHCEISNGKEKYDLTKVFDQIIVEKRDNIFIPDILLSSSKNTNKIYIEIKVSHAVTDEKIASGERIIEFQINHESDIEKIIDFKNGNYDTRHYSEFRSDKLYEKNKDFVKYYNFKKNIIKRPLCKSGECFRLFHVFTVSKNGKCNNQIVSENEMENVLRNFGKHSIFTYTEPSFSLRNDLENPEDQWEFNNEGALAFKAFIAKAHLTQVKLKNCFLCRYHADNISWGDDIGEERLPIFCKFLKQKYRSNDAVECKYYRSESEIANSHIRMYDEFKKIELYFKNQ